MKITIGRLRRLIGEAAAASLDREELRRLVLSCSSLDPPEDDQDLITAALRAEFPDQSAQVDSIVTLIDDLIELHGDYTINPDVETEHDELSLHLGTEVEELFGPPPRRWHG